MSDYDRDHINDVAGYDGGVDALISDDELSTDADVIGYREDVEDLHGEYDYAERALDKRVADTFDEDGWTEDSFFR